MAVYDKKMTLTEKALDFLDTMSPQYLARCAVQRVVTALSF